MREIKVDALRGHAHVRVERVLCRGDRGVSRRPAGDGKAGGRLLLLLFLGCPGITKVVLTARLKKGGKEFIAGVERSLA